MSKYLRGFALLTCIMAFACSSDDQSDEGGGGGSGGTPAPDMGSVDMASPDMASPDMAVPDAALPDMAIPDAALPDAAVELCEYPANEGVITPARVIPPLYWENSIFNREVVPLDLHQIYCEQSYKTIHFIIGTGWCIYCPDYIRRANAMAEAIEAEGGLLVFVEAQDSQYMPSTTDSAQHFLRRLIGNQHGFRVGDGDTLPIASAFLNAPSVNAFPAGMVVRVRDMVVIADEALSTNRLPFDQIAADPEANWGAVAPDFNCGDEDEETYEGPNNDANTAPAIEAGSFSGGICGFDRDYYRINIAGDWRLDLNFSHEVGDLDIILWDLAAGEPVLDDEGRAIGSSSSDDNESFEHSGPATVMIYGYQSATAPYELTLVDLSGE